MYNILDILIIKILSESNVKLFKYQFKNYSIKIQKLFKNYSIKIQVTIQKLFN